MGRAALLWLSYALAVACLARTPVFAQESPPAIHFLAIPPHGENLPATKPSAVRGAAAGPSLPMWDFTTTASRDGKTYTGTMVGRSPFFHGARTTNIDAVLIPLRITIRAANGFQETFDASQPTTPPTCLPTLPNETATALSLTLGSPLLMATSFNMNGVDEGSAQYIDAYQRANFQSVVSPTGDRYHTALNLTKVASAFSITLNSPVGAIAQARCGDIGVIDFKTFDPRMQSSILPTLTAQGVINSTVLPIFLMSNVVMTQTQLPSQQNPLGFDCCVLGYHSGKGSPPNVQLYAVANFDSSGNFTVDHSTLDVYFLSHEIAELIDDPIVPPPGVATVPPWRHLPEVSLCQSDLEVADPLTIVPFAPVTMPNGVSYHLSEFAYFSWFFGGPSIAPGGAFSNQDSLTADAGSDCL